MILCYATRVRVYSLPAAGNLTLLMTKMSALRLIAKRICLVLGLLSCSCLLSSCSSCASFLQYLLSVPFNLLNYVLTSALP